METGNMRLSDETRESQALLPATYQTRDYLALLFCLLGSYGILVGTCLAFGYSLTIAILVTFY